MSPATRALPEYLKKYVAEQRYERYTSQDHAAWRYIMRQNRTFFGRHAVSVYTEGLKKTGISIERIPRVSEMDDHLAEFGWGAVPVRGFIPPAAFLDFQARGVLPIACDMRTVNHIAYTPAPDIVHEAAGHAPIIADPAYAQYLHRYAQMAEKSIASSDDIRQYEAIRYLSDIKENPDTNPDEVERAEERLKTVTAAIKGTSEMAKVVRMSWWTVEYGLVGKLDQPLIYGAGLLSSVGESQTCLSYKVRKIPLTVDCVNVPYNITEPQPQLFVAPNLDHLTVVLKELESTLSFVRGGEQGLKCAQDAATVNTVILDSGLAVSGQLTEYAVDRTKVSFIKFAGPVQLSFEGKQLKGHGRERHAEGFSSPIGRWNARANQPAHTFTDSDLATIGLKKGQRARLETDQGFEIEGKVLNWHREKDRLLFITWADCTVRRGGKTFFEPAWGEFDMAVGEEVTSVHGGPADRASYGELDIGNATTSPARATPFSSQELEAFDGYTKIRALREKSGDDRKRLLTEFASTFPTRYSKDWLIQLELVELVKKEATNDDAMVPVAVKLEKELRDLATTFEPVTRHLVEKGLTLASLA